MGKIVGLWVLYLGTTLCAFSQVDTSYIYSQGMPYGTLDLRLAKSATRYYYLKEGETFSYRESAPGVKTNTYQTMTTWNTAPYGQGHLREKNGSADNFVMNYRLLPPKNYNPTYSPGYPIIIMFHGGGEAANCWIDERCHWASASYNPVTNNPPAPTDQFHKLLNNDRNLLHGGAQHLTAVNLAGTKLPNDPGLASRAFPGFVLFPQSLNGWGPTSTVEDAIRILRLIIKKYNIDESRVYIHGLSNGGGGVYQALKRAPWLFAAALPMSAVNDGGIINQGMVAEVAKLPLWIFQGGQDNNPTPSRTYHYVRSFRSAGANVRYYLYPHLGHGTWNTAYGERDFFSWILEKRKYNPHIYYGSPTICNTTQAGVKMGFSKGFFAYQWQRDGQIIAGATAAEYTADTPGTYRGRFSRKPNPTESDWERWSDPIVVSEKNPVQPAVDVIGTAHLRGPGLTSTDANNTVKLRSVDPAELYLWYKNGTQINFPGTDIEDTLRVATFVNPFSSGNGTYTLVTQSNNCPSPPSEPINLFFNDTSPKNITMAADAIGFKGTVAASSIFLSWKDVSGLETGYEIWRRTAGAPEFKFVVRTAEDAVSYHDTNLDPGTTYEYKLRAVNNNGRSNYVPSDDLAVNYTFKTLGDTKTPPPPQNLSVVGNTLNTISLTWDAAKDESSVKDYWIYYNNDSISAGGKVTAFTISGLTQNTVYAVRVKAVDFGNHFSQPSNQVIATTYLSGLLYKHSTGAWESLDDSAMVATFRSPEFTGAVANFTLQPRTQDDYFNFQFTGYLNIETEGTYYFNVTSSDGSRLILDGNVLINNDGIHGNKTVASEPVYLTAGPHAIEVQYFDDTGGHTLVVRYKGPGVGDGVNYVAIPDAALRSGTYIPAAPPAAPSDATATGTGMQRIDVAWQFTDDATTNFEVYRATAESGPFEIVAHAEGTSAIDTIALIPGQLYYYKVKTITNGGASGFSNVASASALPDNVPPSVPQGLTVISQTLTNLAFSWQASTDNVGVTVYEIFSGTQLIGTSTINAFTASDLSPNTQYSFTVKAVDASGNRSEASAQLATGTNNTSGVFYSLASGNLNELTTWKRNADGTGESPQNFSDNGQYFMLANRTSTTLGGPWTVGGASSRVIVPAGVTLTADHAFVANVEAEGDAVLNLNHATGPNLVKLSPQSTVNFSAYPTIRSNTYGNIILSGTGVKTFDADTITVLGSLTVTEGNVLKGSPHNASHVRLWGNLTLQGTRPATAADNSIDLALHGTAGQTITTGSDLDLYRITTQPGQTVNVVSAAGTPVKINLGSLNGGGLLLADGSVLNINNHHLILKDAAAVNPAQQTGSISINDGNISIASSAAEASYLYFDPAHHRINRLVADLSGSGGAIIRSNLQIVDGIKVLNGTLTSEANVVLLASPEKTAVIYPIENNGKINGEVIVQQHIPARGNALWYLSAPVNPVTVSEWQESFPITGPFAGSSAGGTSASLFYFRQSAGGWVAYPPSGGANTASIERGVGYAARLLNAEPLTVTVKGNPYQGTVPFALAPGTGGAASDGWNLLGNPYASPVMWNNADGAWIRSGINNVIAIRRNSVVGGQPRGQVVYYDPALGGGIIPHGEAFWVRTYSASPALSIQEKAKVDPDVPVTPAAPVPHVVVSMKQGELTDPAYILFTAEGTDGLDPALDGRKLKNSGMFNFSTVAADTIALAVNNVTNEFCSKTISLNIANAAPGAYALSFANLASLSEIGHIQLVDHFAATASTVTGADYNFTITDDPKSSGRGRFALVFAKQHLDVTTPKMTGGDVCAPGPGLITLSGSQPSVLYQAIDQTGKLLSDMYPGTGQTIEIEILAGQLVSGENKIRVTAGFSGCDRQTLAGEAIVNYVSELTVTTAGDVSVCEGGDVTLEASGAPEGGFYKWFDGNGTLIAGATSASLTVSDVATESVYYVTSAHPNGCESDRAEIHVYADTLDTPVIRMDKDTLYTDAVGYYQWKKDGSEIPGATLPYYAPAESGMYSVVASNGACIQESTGFAFTADSDGDGDGGNGDGGNGDGGDGDGGDGGDGNGDDGDGDGDPVTGIDNGNNSEFVLNIYPMPTTGSRISVLLRSPKTDPVMIEVIDALGRLHFKKMFDAQTLMQGTDIVPASSLYNGIYFIRATQADIRARKKIIVNN